MWRAETGQIEKRSNPDGIAENDEILSGGRPRRELLPFRGAGDLHALAYRRPEARDGGRPEHPAREETGEGRGTDQRVLDGALPLGEAVPTAEVSARSWLETSAGDAFACDDARPMAAAKGVLAIVGRAVGEPGSGMTRSFSYGVA